MLLPLLLMMKVLQKGVMRAGKGYVNLDYMNKKFYFLAILKAISRIEYISQEILSKSKEKSITRSEFTHKMMTLLCTEINVLPP